MANTAQAKSMVSVKSVAVPAEHGGWGFLSEPILLSLLIAPSLAGVGLALTSAALFLLHQPFRIVVKDRRKGRVYERTRLAERFFALYGAVAVMGLAITFVNAPNLMWLIPLVCAAPFAALQLSYELRNDGRSLMSEMVGALVLATAAPSILLAADHTPLRAALVWCALALRIVPAIVYVRARVRLNHGKSVRRLIPVILHAVAVGVLSLLWAAGLVNAVVVLAGVLLLARSLYGLYISPSTEAKVIGFQELFFGIAYAVIGATAL